MSTSKLIDNSRRTHAAKVLAEQSKKNHHHNEHHQSEQHEESQATDSSQDVNVMNEEVSVSGSSSPSLTDSLTEQYNVIREDILKLREDLAHGYDLVKEYIDDKMSLKNLLSFNKRVKNS